MSKHRTGLADSLKQLAEIQVTDWDLMELLHKDIRDLEIANSLKRLGAVKVMEWDFHSVMPAVRRTANIEVDVVGCFKRAAAYKVLEWDFRQALSGERAHDEKPGRQVREVDQATMDELAGRLTAFVEYVAGHLIDEPRHMRVRSERIAPDVLRLTVVLVRRDASMLLGTGGHTAAAIRNVLKSVGAACGVHVLLQILTHEQVMAEAVAGDK